MMLAEATPTADQVLLVSLLIISAGSGLAQIGSWWQGRKKQKTVIYPSPLDVNLVEKLATKEELEKVEAASKHEDAVLHKRITDGRKEVDHELSNLPMQIVTLLRNTGVIRK